MFGGEFKTLSTYILCIIFLNYALQRTFFGWSVKYFEA